MFLLFAYNIYYPQGGSDDFLGVYTQIGLDTRLEEVWNHFDCIESYNTCSSTWEYLKYSRKTCHHEVA